MPAPALTPSTALQRAEQGCTDDDINAFDLAVSAQTPRNSASAPVVCGCTTSPVPLPQPSADGGTNLIPVPVTGAAAALRWGALTTESTCAMPPKAKALVPAGLTRKDYIERIITPHAVARSGSHAGAASQLQGFVQRRLGDGLFARRRFGAGGDAGRVRRGGGQVPVWVVDRRADRLPGPAPTRTPPRASVFSSSMQRRTHSPTTRRRP